MGPPGHRTGRPGDLPGPGSSDNDVAVSEAAPKKKEIRIHVARCRGEACGALLALEETDDGLLMGNMADLAERDGDLAFFLCRRCGGRNLVEEVQHEGKVRTRISGFVAAPELRSC